MDFTLCPLQEEVLKDFEELAGKLPWSDPLKVWKINTNFKKKKTKRKKINQNTGKEKINNGQGDKIDETDGKKGFTNNTLDSHILDYYENPAIKEEISTLVGDDLASYKDEKDESSKEETHPKMLKFRVTCNRAGEKHCFSSNEAARDFGGAVQDYFKWKADMTNFDVEVCTGSNYDDSGRPLTGSIFSYGQLNCGHSANRVCLTRAWAMRQIQIQILTLQLHNFGQDTVSEPLFQMEPAVAYTF